MGKFHIKTWGCQMNYADSEKIAALLEKAGYSWTDDVDDADLVVLNTCSVRQKAEDKVLGLGRKFAQLKEDNETLVVIFTGCMGQRIRRDVCKPDLKYRRKLELNMPWVDHFVPVGDIEQIARLVDYDRPIKLEDLVRSHFSDVVANIPISVGCNNFCSYCIVPFTRGPEVSLSKNKILEEVEEAVNSGHKLISLLGQNVNSWRSKGECFPDLLREVAERDGDFWITFLSSNPMDFSEEMIDVIAGEDKICKYVNLAVQSGSDTILRQMNRKYTRSKFVNTVDVLRSRVPDVRLSTDLIVGFPGETEKNFERTLDLVQELKFDMAYISEYSPRAGTASAKLEDDVPAEVKKKRKEILASAINRNIELKNCSLIGKDVNVLCTKPNFGKSYWMQDVRLIGDGGTKPGTFIEATIESASASGITAKVCV